MSHPLPKKKVIKRLVKHCLAEDIGAGDVTARLTPRDAQVDGKIISREHGIVCGIAWAAEVFKQVGKRHDTKLDVDWKVKDGDRVEPNQTLCRFEGLAHPIFIRRANGLKHHANPLWHINGDTRIRGRNSAHKSTLARYS